MLRFPLGFPSNHPCLCPNQFLSSFDGRPLGFERAMKGKSPLLRLAGTNQVGSSSNHPPAGHGCPPAARPLAWGLRWPRSLCGFAWRSARGRRASCSPRWRCCSPRPCGRRQPGLLQMGMQTSLVSFWLLLNPTPKWEGAQVNTSNGNCGKELEREHGESSPRRNAFNRSGKELSGDERGPKRN